MAELSVAAPDRPEARHGVSLNQAFWVCVWVQGRAAEFVHRLMRRST
jgi:hypothetical protein